MKIIDISILHPDTKKPVSYLDWKLNNPNPNRAEWLVITTDALKPFLLHKNEGNKRKKLTFDEAIANGNCLTRAQGIALYEAKILNIDTVIKGIGGDPLRDWVWTSETDLNDKKFNSKNGWSAWLVNLQDGYVDDWAKIKEYYTRQVADYIE